MSELYDLSGDADPTEGLAAAATALRDGELVVLPTDTVYGIAADAFSPKAVQWLLTTKGRDRGYPVPVLVGNAGVLAGLVVTPPPDALALTERFWPGPLTIVVTHSPTLAWDLGETGGTVAVRMPAHPLALGLLTQTGPLAVSSANRHQQPPALDAAAARSQFGADVSVYLEAGPSLDAVPSTIVDCTGPHPVVLRAGAIGLDRLQEVVPGLVAPSAP